MLRTTSALVSGLWLSATLTACGGGGGMSQSTPEETARGYRQAVVDQEWSRAMGYLTRKAQGEMVGAAYITAAYGGQGHPELAGSFQVLAEKHGVIDAKADDMRERDDLTEILVEMVEWIETNLPEAQGGDAFGKIARDMQQTEYADFEIEGDVARANWVLPDRTRRVSFRLIDGRWYLDGVA